jgi:hypothetical protein
MNELNTTATFKPEIDGPCVPTFIVLTGDYLRKLYISKQYQTQIIIWVADDIDPLSIKKDAMALLMATWQSEAESLYPGEGDYRVRLLDEEGERIAIGSDVEFIIEELQTAPLECETYIWSLLDLDPSLRVSAEGEDCEGNTILIGDYVSNLPETMELCVKQGMILVSHGSLTPTRRDCSAT